MYNIYFSGIFERTFTTSLYKKLFSMYKFIFVFKLFTYDLMILLLDNNLISYLLKGIFIDNSFILLVLLIIYLKFKFSINSP